MDEIQNIKKEESSTNTPNLPPIVNGSPLITQKPGATNKLTKTKTGPSATFIQTVATGTLYDSEESDNDEQPDKITEEEAAAQRTKSVKRNLFYRDGPPPRTQNPLYPKTTKSAEQRLELNRSSKVQATPVGTSVAVPVPPSHTKPEYRVVVQGRETKIENRKFTSEKRQNPNKYDRKLRRIQDSYDGNKYMKNKSHPFLQSQQFLRERDSEEKKTSFRSAQAVELEKKAKVIVEKAIKVSNATINFYKLNTKYP